MSPFKQHYKDNHFSPPIYHFVLGSGYSLTIDEIKQAKTFENWQEKPSIFFKDIQGLPAPKIYSHQGAFRYFIHKPTGLSIVLQSGRIHAYEGHAASIVVQPVVQAFLSGTKKFVITNIAGGMKKKHTIGTVIALTDHVNQTGLSPLVGFHLKTEQGKDLSEKFPDMSQVYDSSMRKQITKEMQAHQLKIKEGVYLGVLGPEMETPAQIKWLNKSSKGSFDAVGMSTVLEVIALKALGADVVGFSLISNPAAGLANSNSSELSSKDMFLSMQKYTRKIVESFFDYSAKKFSDGDYE